MSNIMPVEWHKTCLENMKNSLVKRKKELEDIECQVRRLENECKIRAYQIQEAERRGKKTFDSERFLKPKSK